jgi:hypothetical protein
MTPALRLLSARLACHDPGAVAYVRGHLEHSTALQEAARALGCSLRTASRWAAELGVVRPGAVRRPVRGEGEPDFAPTAKGASQAGPNGED